MNATESPIHSDPEIMGGEMVFVGTRVPVYNLFDYLEAGDSLDEFLAQFPSVSREQAVAALELAKRQLPALRILIDESLPVAFAAALTDHEVTTVRAQRWLGLRNGILLRAAVDAGFEVIVTADKALRHQQNLAAIGIAVVLLTHVRNRMQDLRPLVPRVLTALQSVRKGELIEIRGG